MSWVISTRINRALTQRLFVINAYVDKEDCNNSNTTESKLGYRMKFDIMGATGNAYTVIIQPVPKCNCPDFTIRGNRCKHVYFTILKILRLSQDFACKVYYSDEDLEMMVGKLSHVPTLLVVNKSIRNKLEILRGNPSPVEKKSTDDLCLICMDELDNGDPLIYCEYSCGKPIHKECFEYYASKRGRKCLTCFSSMDYSMEHVNGYINLL